ncbi:MAG: hypothetical protein ACREV9_16845 [Burkholderiales bacterium]
MEPVAIDFDQDQPPDCGDFNGLNAQAEPGAGKIDHATGRPLL